MNIEATTDRDLLELAAKAAGFTDLEYCELSGDEPYLRIRDVEGGSQIWSSLADDGDALRLAVKLGISVQTDDGVLAQYRKHGVHMPIFYPDPPDKLAATRRAITRAAAAVIGKAGN